MSNYYEARYNSSRGTYQGIVYTYNYGVDTEVILYRSYEVNTEEEAIELASDWMTDNEIVAEMM